jgi:hypothetical protein
MQIPFVNTQNSHARPRNSLFRLHGARIKIDILESRQLECSLDYVGWSGS